MLSSQLQLQQVEDRELAISLLTFIHNVKKAINSHLEATRDGQSLAELLMGSFDCLKVLHSAPCSVSSVHCQVKREIFVLYKHKLFLELTVERFQIARLAKLVALVCHVGICNLYFL